MRPIESRDEWFNLFVIHQNRVAHGPKNYINEAFLDGFLNLILWGHEHECLIQPAPTSSQFWITQPGSTIATSLSEFEAKPKHVGLLEVFSGKFRVTPIPLTTVRPYLIEDVVLSSVPGLTPNDHDKIYQYLCDRVEDLINQANQKQKEENRPIVPPLIRIKVDYTGFSLLNPSRFGQAFVGRVANPKDILNFHRAKKTKNIISTAKTPEEQKAEEDALFSRAVRPESLDTTKIEDLILSFLGPNGTIEILPENAFTNALASFVEKEEKTAISEFIKKVVSTTQKYLESQDPSKTKTLDDIQGLVIEQTSKQNTLDAIKRKEKNDNDNSQNDDPLTAPSSSTNKRVDNNTDDNSNPSKKPKVKKEKKVDIINLDDEDEDDIFMFDEKNSKVSVKKEQQSASQSQQSKKRGFGKIDDFVAPKAPAPKKTKTKPKPKPKPIKEEEATSSRGLLENLLDESNDSESTKSVRTDKWGRKKS